MKRMAYMRPLAKRESCGEADEQALRTSEIRYRRLFEAARDGVLLMDIRSRKITDANPFMSELLGYPHHELIGKELWEIGLMRDEKQNQDAFTELQRTHYVRYDDLPLKSKDGKRREVEFVSNVYDEAGQQVIQCNIREITERKKHEKAMHNALAKLGRAKKECELLVQQRTAALQRSLARLEAFSYSLSHDMRAPIRAIQSYSEMALIRSQSNGHSSVADLLEKVVSSAKRLDALVQDVLTLSRLSHQKIPLEPLDLEKLVRDVVLERAELQPERAHLEIISPLGTVCGHIALLTQALTNLLDNAVKFVEPSVKPHIRIWSENRDEHFVRLWIEDNGIGIPSDARERVFELFERLNRRQFEGTGIGLAIVRTAIERMNGHVGVESEAGQGSRFWIELPQINRKE